jgi:hypothetical protein
VRKIARRTAKTAVKRSVRPNVRGKGGYWGDLWKKNRKYLPRAIGGALGTAFGRPQEGWDVGAKISDIVGWGPYSSGGKVRGNSLISAGNVPTVNAVGDSGMRLRHVEMIGAVTSTTSFSLTSYSINPGLPNVFPWLSNVARNFQQYKIHGMVICFKSSLTNAVATFDSLGKVIIATDLNPAASAPSSAVQMEQMQFASAVKPSEDLDSFVECDRSLGGREICYVRVGDVPSNASVADYDHGNLLVATDGQPEGGKVLGWLYASYDLTLFNPKLIGATDDLAVARIHFEAPLYTKPFGTTQVAMVDTMDCEFNAPLNNSMTIHEVSGDLIVSYSVVGLTGAGAPSCTWGLTNATAISDFPDSSGGFTSPSITSPQYTGTASSYSFIIHIHVTDSTHPVTLIPTFGGAFPGGTCAAEIVITQVPYNNLARMAPAPSPFVLSVHSVDIAEEEEKAVFVPDPRVPSAAQSVMTVKRKAL